MSSTIQSVRFLESKLFKWGERERGLLFAPNRQVFLAFRAEGPLDPPATQSQLSMRPVWNRFGLTLCIPVVSLSLNFDMTAWAFNVVHEQGPLLPLSIASAALLAQRKCFA